MRKRDRLVSVVAVLLIAYGMATMRGLIHWPGQGGARTASASIVGLSTPCSSVSATTSSTTTLAGATKVTVTAQAAGCSAPLYEFWIQPPGAAGFQVVRAYSNRPTFTWTPVDVKPGPYAFAVWARDAGGDGRSVNSAGRLDVGSVAGTFIVNACSALGVTVNRSSSRTARAAINVAAVASGCTDPLYRFWLLAPGAAAYQMVQDYSVRPVLSLSTSTLPVGTYRIAVWARDRVSSGADGNGLGRWDTSITTTYRIG